MERDFDRRRFLQTTMYAGAGTFALVSCTTGNSRPGTGPSTANGFGAALSAIEGGQVILDPAQFPTTFKESPEFAKAVAAGKLPAVAERIGQDPLVLKPLHGIGRYGGQLRRGYLGVGDRLNGIHFCAGPDSLVYYDYTGKKTIPNMARSFELSDKNRVLTVHLRRGMKWSDGKPFTADDIVFWRDDINLNEKLGGGTASLRAGDEDVKVQKVDQYTVQFISAVPNPLLPELLAGSEDVSGAAHGGHLMLGGFAPKHYLSQFHPKYTSEAQANKLAKAAGFKDWTLYLADRMSWEGNTELPAVTPWMVSRSITSPPWELTANPYSIWVDTEGNQLPYIPKVTMGNAPNTDVINLHVLAGEYDFQDRSLQVASIPALLKSQQRGNYTVHRAPSNEMDFGVRINLAYDKDKVLGELLRNVDFRRALALGIDRDQLNQTFALGTSTPSATMAANTSKYFPGPEWRKKWASHDVAQANSLLDKIGLAKRDGQGYRLRPDGKGRIRLQYDSVKASFADFVAMGEMIRRQWQQIGIDVIVQDVAPNLLVQRTLSNEMMLSGHRVGTHEPFLYPDTFMLTNTSSYPGMIGIPYAKWFASHGRTGIEPPESLKLLKDAMSMYREGLAASEEKRIELGKELYKLHADQVWSIGVLGFGLMFFGLYSASNKLGNVPNRVLNATTMKVPSNAMPMTFYYK